MLECAIHPITYRGEGILATVVKIPILFIFFLHIQQARVKIFSDSGLSILIL